MMTWRLPNGSCLCLWVPHSGIKPVYKVSEEKPTGTCMVLVTNKERCVCTNLGASVDIDEAFIQDKWAEVAECKAVYCTGFLMTSSTAVSRHEIPLRTKIERACPLRSENLQKERICKSVAIPESWIFCCWAH